VDNCSCDTYSPHLSLAYLFVHQHDVTRSARSTNLVPICLILGTK
jgi:hypothetical protein